MKRCLRRGAVAAAILLAGLTTARGWAQGGKHSGVAEQKSGKAVAPTAAKIDWNAPLPSESEMRQRVLTNLKQSQAEQERYICKAVNESEQTDKNGKVKSRNVSGYDMFFVSGQEIDEKTSKDGKPLNASQQKKEAERVKKQIEKDSDTKYVAKKEADDEKQLDTALRMLCYSNGHRIDVQGRSTLVYDLSGDPKVHPKGIEETFLHDMTGTIQVDEATGELIDLNARLDHDVKVGAGLLANLHKGFWIHVRQKRYPDGVWLTDLAEGTGDARAALFFHPYFRFKQTINSCVLTNVTTSETAPSIAR